MIWTALIKTGSTHRALEAFANCGSGVWLQGTTDGQSERLSCNHCRSRWCIPCATARARTIIHNLDVILAQHPSRFLTLTLRHSHTPLRDQIDRIYRSFAALRRRKPWIQHVSGGAAFLECKLSPKSGMWHVHLHVLLQGQYWEQKEIVAEWYAVTGDSYIVDVRRIDSREHAAAYVAKYVTKPADATVYTRVDALEEMIIAMRGRRLCTTFGDWRQLRLTDVPADDREWITIGRVDRIFRDAAEGDARAQLRVVAMVARWPGLRIFLIRPPPETPPHIVAADY